MLQQLPRASTLSCRVRSRLVVANYPSGTVARSRSINTRATPALINNLNDYNSIIPSPRSRSTISVLQQEQHQHQQQSPQYSRQFSTTMTISSGETAAAEINTKDPLGVGHEPIDPKVTELLEKVENMYPERWRKDCWYLTTTAALISTNQPTLVGQLYRYLIAQPAYSTSDSRKALIRRLREALIKCIILNGIPIVMVALLSLTPFEAPEDQDLSFNPDRWVPNEQNLQQGMELFNIIYAGEDQKRKDFYAGHKDIPWISRRISYALFLADHSVLNYSEGESIVLPAIMGLGLQAPTFWHLRGCVRVGFERSEVEEMHKCIEEIAKFGGKELPKDMPRVDSVGETEVLVPGPKL